MLGSSPRGDAILLKKGMGIMKEIYVISTIRLNAEGIDDQRPIGFFRDYHEAKIRIEGNSCDMFEAGYYKYAVILKITEGIYPHQEEVQWFEYCKITDNVVEINKPNIKHIDGQEFRPYVIG